MEDSAQYETQSRQTIIDRARVEDVAIRCTAPDGSVCDIVAVPLQVVNESVWIEMQVESDGYVEPEGRTIPLHDGVHNRIHACEPDVELIPEGESLFGGSA